MPYNRRMSLGGGALRPDQSLNRRMSISAGPLRSETPRRDRRIQLEAYREQKRARDRSMDESFEYPLSQPRPPLGPVSMGRRNNASTAPTEAPGENALARIRRMQQQKRQRNMLGGSDENVNNTFPFENDTIDFSQKLGAASPSRSNVLVPRPMSSGRKPLSSQESLLSQENEIQLSQESASGSVESVARYQMMQQRLRELEEEKMGITIAIAPMEARHRQKEDAWLKEQNRLLQEIDSLKSAGRSADERYRDLRAQFEATEDENRQLRLQVRKESTSVYSKNNQSESSWSRHVQADRDVKELREKLQSAQEEIRAGRLNCVSIEKELHATKIERDSIIRAYEELQEEYEEISSSKSNDQDAQIQLEVLTNEHIATSAQLNAVCSDLAATKAAFDAEITAKDETHKREIEKFEFEMSVLKTRAASGMDENGLSTSMMTDSGVEDYAVLKARIEERDRKIAEFENERLAWEAQRRQMHNRIQELRGNIRVFVRTRPFLPNDGNETSSAIDVSPDGESLSILDARTNSPYDFKFDKVFAASSGQDHVFDEVSDFVQSAIDGYQVCLFSYGQTGSGKTHTMQGSGNGAMRGIIPRAVEQILFRSKEMQDQRWVFNLSASFLEIYNENLKDLLVDMGGHKSKNQPKLSIKRSREGKSYVDNLTEVPIETNDSMAGMQQLDTLMKIAARSRSVASTKMNAQSSRSHSVFMLHLRGYNEESGAEVHGALNLCDLAGSERLDRSGAGNDAKRLRETQAINKSLSCLGDVFNALAQKASHVPYRNSKLTYLLQDCLSGDGKALMFVNLSPTNASSNESLCSLRFAQRVNQVELGKATKHINYNR